MSTPTVDAALAEIRAELEEWTPIVEGNRDLSATDVTGDTSTVVNGEIRAGEALEQAMVDAIALLEKMNSLGYPARPPLPVAADVLADIREQQRTINLAADRYIALGETETFNASVGKRVPRQ